MKMLERKLLSLCPSRRRGFVLKVLSIKRERIFFEKGFLKGLVHDNAHARRLSLRIKFVGSVLNSKSPLPVQSLKILRFIRTSVALAGLVILP